MDAMMKYFGEDPKRIHPEEGNFKIIPFFFLEKSIQKIPQMLKKNKVDRVDYSCPFFPFLFLVRLPHFRLLSQCVLMHPVTAILSNFVKQFQKACEENIQQAEADRKKAQKEA